MRRLGPALCLTAYGAAFGVRAFGGGLPAFDDHPGQFFRLWHALERSFPDGRWTADWNPDWWGGYPELQFYPPGFALAGAGLRLLALWQPSVETIYQALCVLILLLPALTTYALLARILGDGWLALPAAFLALTLSAGLRGGVEESLRWGILTSRLSMGLLPLLALTLRAWIDDGRRPAWTPLAAAAVVLAHPASAPVVATMLALATFLAVSLRPRRATVLDAGAIGVLTLGLLAFWLFPLLVRRAWVVPLAWGNLGPAGLFAQAAARPLLVLVALAAFLAWIPVIARRRPFDAFVAALPIFLAATLVADAFLFGRGWSPIEPDRLTDGLLLATLAAAGLGSGALVAAATAARARGPARPVAAAALVGLAALLPNPAQSEPTLTLWPQERARLWTNLPEIERAHDLPTLWNVLRAGTDRVLFLTSALRLGPDTAWYAPHSHVLSLAPVFAGREIVHGLFTHPAPLAARFYAGTSVVPPRIETLVEELDGRRLLGEPWERVTPQAFEAFARRLRIATIVVPTADAGRARFLRDRYAAARVVGGLTVFERRDRPWPQVDRITHRRYRVFVPPTGGVWVPTGIPAYPLWQAKSGQGRLETREDAWGLLEFRVPLDLFEAELVYSEGALEWTALLSSLAAAAASMLWARQGSTRAATSAVRKRLSVLERRRKR